MLEHKIDIVKLNLKRPLIFFDLETTGTNITRDRIVELSYIKVYPDGHTESKTRRLNPGMPIPPGATAVHHITDEMVKDEPSFRQISKALLEIFEGCDIAGYNSNKFDVPLLIEEFGRAGLNFEVAGRKFIDVQNIFHKMEQRTLVAAYKFYCGRDLADAHSALADTQAARIVLDDNDVPVFNFGKHKGKPVKEVFRKEPSFYTWMMQGDFAKNTKDVISVLYAECRNQK